MTHRLELGNGTIPQDGINRARKLPFEKFTGQLDCTAAQTESLSKL